MAPVAVGLLIRFGVAWRATGATGVVPTNWLNKA